MSEFLYGDFVIKSIIKSVKYKIYYNLPKSFLSLEALRTVENITSNFPAFKKLIESVMDIRL